MNNNYYDLFFTAIKHRDDKQIANDEYQNYENDLLV